MKCIGPIADTNRSRVSVEKNEPELCHIQDNVLIERVQNEFGNPSIGIAPVHEKQSSQKSNTPKKKLDNKHINREKLGHTERRQAHTRTCKRGYRHMDR